MKTILLCLHGWGGSKESFTELREELKDDPVEIWTPDLPGFGDEPDPKEAWNVDDYADWVEGWLRQKCKGQSAKGEVPRNLFLLGHSHGGRIAILLAARASRNHQKLCTSHFALSHLYLCAAAGIRRRRHFTRILGLALAKGGKAVLGLPGLRSLQPLAKKALYKLVRVHDYEKASPIMQATLAKVSAQNLEPLLKEVHIPTDIFWGIDDRQTPIADGRIIHAAIKGSKLHTYKGVRHRVHRDRAMEIAAVLRSFV